MADLSDLIRKQEQKRDAKSKGRVRIERTGPTRPWQQGLPQYEKTAKLNQSKRAALTKTRQDEPVKRRSAGSNTRSRALPEICPDNETQPISKIQEDAPQSGATASTSPVDSPGYDVETQPETTGDINGRQVSEGRLRTGGINGRQEPFNGGQTTSEAPHLPRQRETSMPCPPKNDELSPVEMAQKSPRVPLVPRLAPPSLPLQQETILVDKGGQLPTSRQELALLFCLVQEVLKTGLNMSKVLKRNELADLAEIGHSSIKKVRTRLLQTGHVTCTKAGEGRSRQAGCVYAVSEEAIAAFKQKGGQKHAVTGDKNGGQILVDSDSSSRSLNISTTTKAGMQRELVERFRDLLEKIEISPVFKVDANDVLGWWLKVEKDLELTIEDFEDSFERWVFKLTSTPPRGGLDPKAVLAGKVLKQVCGVPTGFLSWRQKQIKMLEEAQATRHQEMRRLQLAQYESGFTSWFERATDDFLMGAISDDDRSNCRPQRGEALNRTSPVLREATRRAYASERNIDYEHWIFLADEVNAR